MFNRIHLWGLAAIVAFLAVPSTLFAQGITSVATDSGTTSWMLTSTTLVLLMTPGLALFYGGLVRTKNVVGTMMQSFAAMAVVGVLWSVIGYALSFGPSVLGGWIGWNSDLFCLKGIDETVMSSGVPEYVFAMFQGKFAIITPALIAGAIAERVTFKGWVAFITLWILFVYAPICHWVWASDGFFFNLGAKGAIDFAGGTVVHISSGISGLVLAIYLGARRGYPKLSTPPSNMTFVLLGVGLLWVGWFGFNAGSAIASNIDAARALTVTQVAAATAALTWVLIEAILHGKPTSLGMASGILAGLVVITPAAGVVNVSGAIGLGMLASIGCYSMITLKSKLGYDDSLDAFGVHGVGGIIGAICLTFFIRDSWWADAGTKISGWNWFSQLKVQLMAVGTTIVYAAIMTLIIGFIVQKTIGLRMTENGEKAGMDHDLHGERGYGLNNLN